MLDESPGLLSCDTAVSPCPGVPKWDSRVMLGYPASPLPRATMQTEGWGLLGCPGILGQRGTGQLSRKVERDLEATSPPHAHAAVGMSPHHATPGCPPVAVQKS